MHAKKLLTFSAAAVMALSLTACGIQPQTAASESTASIHEETSASATATDVVEATTQERITILEVNDVSEINKSYFKAQVGTGATNTIMNASKMTHKEVFDQLVENFGVQEILVGDSIDLRNYCDYDLLSDDEKVILCKLFTVPIPLPHSRILPHHIEHHKPHNGDCKPDELSP